jgi:NAD(P)-dependent dehydrogenase (short-subunit alcohol dehydrogenase family)
MKTWFITGATRGLGAELARYALDHGDNVVATGRSTAAISETLGSSDRLLVAVLDVTREDDARAAVAAACGRFGRIDVLVNNAGRGLIGAIEETSDAEARELFDINVFGLLNVTRAAVPVLREQGSGCVLNVTSAAGYSGEAAAGIYSGSKFAVEGITEALRKELAVFGIGVMAVEPGATRTDFLAPGSLGFAKRHIEPYDRGAAGETREYVANSHRLQTNDPVKAVAVIYEAVHDGEMPHRLPLGQDAVAIWDNKLREVAKDIAPWRARSSAVGCEALAAPS